MNYRRTFSVFALALLAMAGIVRAQESPTGDLKIHLEAAEFDPLKGPARVAPELRLSAGSSTERWIVQFHRPLTREQRELLTKEYGLKLTAYIPNQAYLERLPSEARAKLQQLGLVRALVAYGPGFKISPRIGKVRFRTEERRRMTGLLLRAVLFDDASLPEVTAALAAIPGVSQVEARDFREQGAPARIEFLLASKRNLPQVARLEGVRWIEEVAEQIEDNGNTAGTIQSGTPGTVPVWDKGIHGEGQIVGVIDGGVLDINHCMFQDPAGNTPGPLHRKVLEVRGPTAASHATFVSGIVAGDDFNNLGTGANRGNAWAARLVAGRRSEGILSALTSNSAQGATIHTNSWHDNTNGAGNPALYNTTAADADTFTWNNEDHLVLGSMGNNGEEQGPPGTAKNSLGITASLRDPNEMGVGDGNDGPTADGRRKPDLVTPGCLITSAQVSTACTISLSNACATSWATPAAAATTALIRQYYTEGWYPTGTPQPANVKNPSGALIKATLLNATIDMTNEAGYPSNTEGWGLARLNNTLFFPGAPRQLRAWDVRNADGLATGEFRTFSVDVASAVEPLKVTLVWTEPPGTSGAANPVINNLNLTVIAPNGSTFLGNAFAAGQSTTGGAPDALNNVEQVLVGSPAVGTWTVRVAAPAVNVGLPGQGFAVTATASMSAPQIQVPGDLHLAEVCVGATGLGTLEVCNTGTANLIVDSIASSNPRVAVTTPSGGFPVTISHDFCFPFQVTLAPTTTGPQSATLAIASNDPETPTVPVTVEGEATQRDILVTGSTAFGVASAWSPAERTVRVCNVGRCALSVNAAAIDCPDFSLVGNPLPVSLPSSGCADLVVGFTPVLPGPKTCHLTITSDDPDTPAVVRTLTARTPPAFSLHAGRVEAHGVFANVARDGAALDLDFLSPLGPNFAVDVRLGFARFDGQPGQSDTDLWKLGANAKYTFNPAAPVHVFVNGGPNLYHFDPGTIEGGINLGLGLNVPAGSRFSFEATYNYHWALTAAPDLTYDQIELGLLISF